MNELRSIGRRLRRPDLGNRLERVGGALLVALAALALLGQAMPTSTPRVIEAERFVVRDSTGTIRGQLGMMEGVPRLVLYDEAGRSRVRLFVEADAVHLFFVDQGDHSRMRLFVGKDSARLQFADVAEQERALFGITDGKPSLVLRDEVTDRAVLGQARVKLDGAEEQRSASSLVLLDQDGKVVWKVP